MFCAVFVVALVKIASSGSGISEDRFPWIPDHKTCLGIGCVVMTRAASPEGRRDRWVAADGENIIRRARSRAPSSANYLVIETHAPAKAAYLIHFDQCVVMGARDPGTERINARSRKGNGNGKD